MVAASSAVLGCALPSPSAAERHPRAQGRALQKHGGSAAAAPAVASPGPAVAARCRLHPPPRQAQAQPPRRAAVRAAAASPLSMAPGLEALRAAELPLPEAELGRAVRSAFGELFWGSLAAPRVLDSFQRLLAGEEFIHHHPGLGLEHANSYIEGLTTVPFPDPYSGAYKWLEAVEAQAAAIQEEFFQVTADANLASKGNNIWVPAVRSDAGGYGDDWRTLVLQDRGHWDEDNVKLFPRTAQIVKDLQAPTQEVFFARQPAGTGIKSHTDFVNFIQTSHLGIQVPEGDCWIKVGEQTRKWEERKVVVCHTSFMHETANNTEGERIVLILRHFHPEVTPLERTALQFVFDCLDSPTRSGIAAASSAAQAALAASGAAGAQLGRKGGKGGKKGKDKKGGGAGKGFGAPKA